MHYSDKCLRKYFIHSLNNYLKLKQIGKSQRSIIKERLLTNEFFKKQILPRRLTVRGLINSSPYLMFMDMIVNNLKGLENSLIKQQEKEDNGKYFDKKRNK